jgi:hypothetical protein
LIFGLVWKAWFDDKTYERVDVAAASSKAGSIFSCYVCYQEILESGDSCKGFLYCHRICDRGIHSSKDEVLCATKPYPEITTTPYGVSRLMSRFSDGDPAGCGAVWCRVQRRLQTWPSSIRTSPPNTAKVKCGRVMDR